MDEVRAAVSEAFGPLNPREDISLSRLSELTVQIRKKVEGSTEEERRHAFMPPSTGTLLTIIDLGSGFHIYSLLARGRRDCSRNLGLSV